MKIKLEGTAFTVTCREELTPEGERAYQQIRQSGGRTTNFTKSGTDVLIYEGGYSLKPEKARAWGIPVIDSQQLVELVRRGELEIASDLDTDRGERGMDELLGEARGLLAKPPSEQVWKDLCALMESCLPEQTAELADYVLGHLQRWPRPARELCAAPHAWLVQLMRGVESPKFRIAQALELFEEPHASTAVIKALKNPELTGLIRLVLNSERPMSRTFYRQLHKLPSCQGLLTLGFNDLERDWSNELRDGEGLGDVDALLWMPPYEGFGEWKRGFFSFAARPQVSIRHVDFSHRQAFVLTQRDVSRLNKLELERVSIAFRRRYNQGGWLQWAANLPRAKELEITFCRDDPSIKSWFRTHTEALVVPLGTERVTLRGENLEKERAAIEKKAGGAQVVVA